jgi:osmoprotectant transport system substrate-binding protein
MRTHRSTAPLLLALLLTAAIAAVLGGCAKKEKSVTVGAKGFAESQIVSKVFQYALEDAGYTVFYKDGLDGDVLQTAIETGEIDLYPEYTNTGIMNILKADPIFDPDEAYEYVKKAYKEKFNIVWLQPSNINDSYCFVVTKTAADKYNLKTISDLKAVDGEIRAIVHTGWDTRADIRPALNAAYGEFKFKSETQYGGGLAYQVMLEGLEDLNLGTTTEANLVRPELVVLEDDKGVWPPYHLTPIIRQETLDKYPDIEKVINSVSGHLTTEEQIKLNARATFDFEEVDDIARELYEQIKNG